MFWPSFEAQLTELLRADDDRALWTAVIEAVIGDADHLAASHPGNGVGAEIGVCSPPSAALDGRRRLRLPGGVRGHGLAAGV